jgi:histidinol-phosphate aminotransferase
MSKPQPLPGIMEIKPYVGGIHHLDGIEHPVVLSANETPLGPSERAVRAYNAVAGDLHRYPEGGSIELRQALQKRYDLDMERIVCGCGSDELITLLIRAFAGPGDEVIHSRHGFLMYAIAARVSGATPVAAPEANFTTDVDAILASVTPRTKMVLIANPNNPTGSYISTEELRRLAKGLPGHVVLIIDAAYAEYVTRNDYTAGAELVDEYENVVMTRTFSKIFGLAAVRLGWSYSSAHVAGVLNRVRNPFNVTVAAQAAGIAALEDIAHMDRGREHNDKWLPWLTGEMKRLGLAVHPSVGNFIMVRFKDAATANAAYNALLKGGFITRLIGGYGLPECLRITVGLEEEIRPLVACLEKHLAEAS